MSAWCGSAGTCSSYSTHHRPAFLMTHCCTRSKRFTEVRSISNVVPEDRATNSCKPNLVHPSTSLSPLSFQSLRPDRTHALPALSEARAGIWRREQEHMSTLRGHDVERRKTQVHVPRVQPQSAGLSTVTAERPWEPRGAHQTGTQRTRTASLAKDVVVPRLRLKK